MVFPPRRTEQQNFNPRLTHRARRTPLRPAVAERQK